MKFEVKFGGDFGVEFGVKFGVISSGGFLEFMGCSTEKKGMNLFQASYSGFSGQLS